MFKHNYYEEYHPDKGRSIMAHIRRTRHIMMPAYRACFSYSIFSSKGNPASISC